MDADSRPAGPWERPIDLSAFARPLGEEYLEAVRWGEDMDCNRPHEDKSWVVRVEESRRDYFSRVRPAQRA